MYIREKREIDDMESELKLVESSSDKSKKGDREEKNYTLEERQRKMYLKMIERNKWWDMEETEFKKIKDDELRKVKSRMEKINRNRSKLRKSYNKEEKKR